MTENMAPSAALKGFEQPGLYLILRDSTRLILTDANIEKATTEYWSNPEKIPPSVKKAVEFARCGFCPLKGKDDLCDALRPVLPFLDVFDRFRSHDEVLAVYRPPSPQMLFVSETTMHGALRHISMLSLMKYCQEGRKHWKYYLGTAPLMSDDEIVNRVYLNMYWLLGGDEGKVAEAIASFAEEIATTARNQVRRLGLIVKNDAFLNALVRVQMISQLLSVNHADMLRESFEKFADQ